MREVKYVEGNYGRLEKAKWFRAWNHPRNPFGNWHEPMPYPEKRRLEAPKNEILAWLWWQFLRNPLHNFTHFVIGIVPIGDRYEWVTPDEDGWIRRDGEPPVWVRYRVVNGKPKEVVRRLRSCSCKRLQIYCGWLSRGAWGFSIRFRKQ